MFLGQYAHNIDEKGRLTVPSKHRELLVDGAYITRGFDRNLMVLTSPTFERIYQRVNQLSLSDQNARLLKRMIFSNAERLEIDRAGRILIPQYLREFACLDGEALIVGAGEYFEIWSQQTWSEQTVQLENTDATAQRFAALDLSFES